MRSQYVDNISFSDIACILVVFVGIWSFCSSIVPRNGCRRLAKSTHSEAENHAVSVILQVARMGFRMLDRVESLDQASCPIRTSFPHRSSVMLRRSSLE